MARKRRMSKVAFNQGLVVNVAIASLLVQKGPELLNRFLFSSNPLTGYTATAAGVGAAWLVGSLMKKSDIANAGIALGAVEFVSPLIDDIVGGVTGGAAPKMVPSSNGFTSAGVKSIPGGVADYFGLNDYSEMPRKQNWQDYYNSY
jgi:hypothetical protein